MTKPFTDRQKVRILVAYGALMRDGESWVPIAQYRFGTMNKSKRLAIARRVGCAVKCACGCETWALLQDIEFDHDKEHANGGATVIANGQPLRRTPCHAAKTAASQAVTGLVRKVRRKLRVRSKDEVWEERHGAGRTSKPRRRPFPKSRRPMRSRPFPTRHEVRL